MGTIPPRGGCCQFFFLSRPGKKKKPHVRAAQFVEKPIIRISLYYTSSALTGYEFFSRGERNSFPKNDFPMAIFSGL